MSALTGSNNQPLLLYDTIHQFVGINNSNPSYTLDVAGNANFRSNMYILGASTTSGVGFFQESINVQNNILMSNTTGFAVTYCASNNLIGINQSSPQYMLDVNGSINAVGYCNLLINSYSNSSVNNAPTCLALSNVYSEVVSVSNTAIYASNNIQYNQYYKKLIKNLDSSNAITSTVTWQNASTSNQYGILLNIDQMLGSSNLNGIGIKNQRLMISTSNYGILYSEIPEVFGLNSIYTTINTTISASNSTSVSLQSTNTLSTTGPISHMFSIEVVGTLGASELGAISLS